MSKADTLAEGRNQGLDLALRIIKDAKKNGSDCVTALEEEMRKRRITKAGAPKTYAEWKHDQQKAIHLTYKVALIIAMSALWGEFDFDGDKALPAFVDAYIRYVMEVGRGGTSVEELLELLKAEVGVTVDLDADNLVVDFHKAGMGDKIY